MRIDLLYRLLPLGVFTCMLVASISVASAGSAVAAVDAASPALMHDARNYAAAMHVSVETAIERLRLQETVGELDQALTSGASDHFGGLYIQHEPTFGVVVQVTDQAALPSSTWLADQAELAPYVTVETVANTLVALTAAQAHVQQRAADAGLMVESSVDLFENGLDIFVGKATMATYGAESLRRLLSLPDFAELVPVDGLSTPTASLYGGLHLTSCTSGFSVVRNNGTRGITTAGHCANAQSYAGPLVFQSEKYSGGNDIQWHTQTGSSVTNSAYFGVHTRVVKTWVTSHTVGKWVCKYGRSTGYDCGQIKSNTHNPTGCVPNATSNYVRVYKRFADLSEPGDSGGPFMSGNSAYGSMSCQFGLFLRDAIYMPIDRVSSLGGGMDVLTYR